MVKIALLRGINVSGQKKIKMAELKIQLKEIGLDKIETYIQSGNIVFDSKKPNKDLQEAIIQKIKNDYNFEVPVIVFDQEHLENIINNNPFKKEAIKNPKQTLVTFGKKKFLEANINQLKELKIDNEFIQCFDKHLYLHTPLGYGKAKLNNNFLERKLNTECTTRNWSTVEKLIEMCLNK